MPNPSKKSAITDCFKGLSLLTPQERLDRLVQGGFLNDVDGGYFLKTVSPDLLELFDHFIENSIGGFTLPLGFAPYFRIDNKDYVIPMAVEETSVIAAASKTAKWIRQHGHITTASLGNEIVGQIQIARVQNAESLSGAIETNKNMLIELAHQHVLGSLVKRGGGIRDIHLRKIQRPDGDVMAVIHVHLDPCDAMGANLITQACEYLAGPIHDLTGEDVSICILSNLSMHKRVKVQIILPSIDRDLACKLEELSLFAELDPYRAVTHNKGIMNGIDAVLIATGNDWRAVEGGLHAFAAHNGSYKPLTRWTRVGAELIGEFDGPIMVGTVGGVTNLHPTARACLRLLGITKSQELARIVAAVGLVQNLGAMMALVNGGIMRGHMRLHIQNIILGTDATPDEKPLLKNKLKQKLKELGRLSNTDAQIILAEMRGV
ncbi:MAG: hydroxymethylglutaryl-CoA reductase, degradative [Alphaproteobacteria bacterium]|nr:hydroxymethylglutaryl-CoA reductase, degradative [Alphaproteobacteria bacterium]